MTTHKPKVFRFHCHGHNAPAYSCNRPDDNSGEYVRLSDYEALQAECEKLRKDAERYRWLSQRLVGASFDWDDEGMTILAFEMPDGVSIGADCDKNIDTAMQEDSQ